MLERLPINEKLNFKSINDNNSNKKKNDNSLAWLICTQKLFFASTHLTYKLLKCSSILVRDSPLPKVLY